MSRKRVFCIRVCTYCDGLFFGKIDHDVKFEDIDLLVDCAQIKFLVCKECTVKIKETAKEVLKMAFKDEEKLKSQFIQRKLFQIVK